MATSQFISWIERQADGLRRKCALKPFAKLDPFELAKAMNIPVVTPHDIPNLSTDILTHVLEIDGEAWDAATLPLPDDNHIIVMNPTRPKVRQHASLMEELSHVHLKHKPSTIRTVHGIVLREWKQSHETQAYWVGAAALVPQRVLKGAITRGMTRSELAIQCDVSVDLVLFRERILSLKLDKAG